MYQKLIYGVDDTPPLFNAMLLSLQHCILMTSTLFLPAIMVAAAFGKGHTAEAIHLTQASMIAMGIGSLFMYCRQRWMGSGYLCPFIIEPAFLAIGIITFKIGGIQLLLGMGFLAGIFEILLSFFYNSLRKIIPTEVMGVVIIMIGVGLISPIMNSAFHLSGTISPSIELRQVSVFLITFFSIIACSIWGNRIIAISNLLIGCAIGYLAAFLLHDIPLRHTEAIEQSPLFALPHFPYFAHFHLNSNFLLAFMIAAFATIIKVIGNITTCQKINDPQWVRPEPRSIRSSIITNGVTSMLSSLMGGLPLGTSSSNIAFSQATKVTSRRLNLFIGVTIIILAFMPKVTSFFVNSPSSIRTAVLTYVVCFIMVTGIQITTSRLLDVRRAVVIGASLTFGLTLSFFPIIRGSAGDFFKPLLSSPLASSALCAVFLTLIFRLGIKQKINKTFIIGELVKNNAFNWLMREGEHWGAPQYVIEKTHESLDHAGTLIRLTNTPPGLKGKEANISFHYDEYQLNTIIFHPGKPVDLLNTPTKFKNNVEYAAALAYLQKNTNYMTASANGKNAGKFIFHTNC